MERSAIRGSINARGFPDFAALHPGYKNDLSVLHSSRLAASRARHVIDGADLLIYGALRPSQVNRDDVSRPSAAVD
jgi:uncharacterized heparinase superfamily protein